MCLEFWSMIKIKNLQKINRNRFWGGGGKGLRNDKKVIEMQGEKEGNYFILFLFYPIIPVFEYARNGKESIRIVLEIRMFYILISPSTTLYRQYISILVFY